MLKIEDVKELYSKLKKTQAFDFSRQKERILFLKLKERDSWARPSFLTQQETLNLDRQDIAILNSVITTPTFISMMEKWYQYLIKMDADFTAEEKELEKTLKVKNECLERFKASSSKHGPAYVAEMTKHEKDIDVLEKKIKGVFKPLKQILRLEPTTLFLSLDMETAGFNGPIIEEDGTILRDDMGNALQGCNEHPILEVATMVLDSKFINLGTFQSFLKSDRTYINAETKEFHVKNGFWDKWEKAEKIHTVTAETKIIQLMTDIVRAHYPMFINDYRELDPYTYSNKLRFVLLGKSVHFDRSYINAQMPKLGVLLSHQHADVSAIRTCMATVPKFPKRLALTDSTHNAMDDVIAANASLKVLTDFLTITCPDTSYETLEESVSFYKNSSIKCW